MTDIQSKPLSKLSDEEMLVHISNLKEVINLIKSNEDIEAYTMKELREERLRRFILESELTRLEEVFSKRHPQVVEERPKVVTERALLSAEATSREE